MFGYTQGDRHGIQIDVTRRQRRAKRNNQKRNARPLLQGAQAAEGGYAMKTNEQYRRLEALAADQQERIVTLEARCAELEAHCAMLKETLLNDEYGEPVWMQEASDPSYIYEVAVIQRALESTPAISLANLKADAIDGAANHIRYNFEGPFSSDAMDEFLEAYSNTLRNQAKENT